MKPRDRLMAILEKREPDCIPIVLQSVISSRVSRNLLRLTGPGIDVEPQHPGLEISYRRYREYLHDVMKRNPSGWQKEFSETINTIARSPPDVTLYTRLGVDAFFYPATPGKVGLLDENRVVNEFGAVFSFSQIDGELMQWYRDGYLKTPERRDEWVFPTPEPDRVKAYERALKTCGDSVYPIGFVVGIFELTWQSMGFTEFARALKMNPGFVRRVYSEHAAFAEELAKLFLDAGAEVIGIGDDVAYKNNLMVSPKLWADFVKPFASRIVDAIHKRGALAFMHSDGYITPLVDLIIETGYDGLQSLEPIAGVDLADVKERYGRRIGLMGGIDTSQLLPYGSERDVEEAVKGAISAAGEGGGYAIGPCTEIHWKCKAENVLAMIRYARKHGRYPINTRDLRQHAYGK